MNTFKTFEELHLAPPLARALSRMGFISPTPVQQGTIPPALEGKDILATAQTGTGKTGAFGIPMLTTLADDRSQQALILCPTRELAAQIMGVLREMGAGSGLRGALVVGGESFNRQVNELDRGCNYIVGTPGRLNDHLQEGTLDLSSISMLVLDEVDRMLDMGFLPQLKQLLREVPKERQTMLFSATLAKETTHLAQAFLRNPVRIAISAPVQSASLIKEQTLRVAQQQKNNVILKEMEQRDGLILVFARTKHRTDRLARFLREKGHDVVALHGGRTQGQRKQALEKFRNGSHRIMVATDLAGRGIDIADIQHVINYDLPATREDYIHRIGRTGRFGKSGNAINFLIPGDRDGERILRAQR